jgi:hypothetical protein
MHHLLALHTMLLASSAATGKNFHIGPWIVVPVLLLLGIVGTPIYVLLDRRRRRSAGPVK